MTVAELIEVLKLHPQHLILIRQFQGAFVAIEPSDISVEQYQEARDDGWVHSARPDCATVEYLTIGF